MNSNGAEGFTACAQKRRLKARSVPGVHTDIQPLIGRERASSGQEMEKTLLFY